MKTMSTKSMASSSGSLLAACSSHMEKLQLNSIWAEEACDSWILLQADASVEHMDVRIGVAQKWAMG